MKRQGNKTETYNSKTLAKKRKQAFYRALLKADGHIFQGRGKKKRCFSPFYADEPPIFVVNKNDDDNEGGCLECAWFDDVIEYTMKFHYMNRTAAFNRLTEFAQSVAGFIRKVGPSAGKVTLLNLESTKTMTIDYDSEIEDPLCNIGPPVVYESQFLEFLYGE